MGLFVTNANQPEDLIYEVTKALFHPRSQEFFSKGHPKASHITLETALEGVATPLHPGAERYYE